MNSLDILGLLALAFSAFVAGYVTSDFRQFSRAWDAYYKEAK